MASDFHLRTMYASRSHSFRTVNLRAQHKRVCVTRHSVQLLHISFWIHSFLLSQCLTHRLQGGLRRMDMQSHYHPRVMHSLAHVMCTRLPRGHPGQHHHTGSSGEPSSWLRFPRMQRKRNNPSRLQYFPRFLQLHRIRNKLFRCYCVGMLKLYIKCDLPLQRLMLTRTQLLL